MSPANKEATPEQPISSNDGSSLGTWKMISGVLGVATLAFMGATIGLAVTKDQANSPAPTSPVDSEAASPEACDGGVKKDFGENPCLGKKPDWQNIECLIEDIREQSGANVTKGYKGKFNTTATPITTNYREAGLCPVNVHWHLGAEHLSVGEYDENGVGPIDSHTDEHRLGFQCKYYDANDPRFDDNGYEWKHCIGMTVGQTYEVHWPHSAAGACDTPWQYQTPFYDGVFCMDGVLSLSTTHEQIGVQSQTFTIINDEEYYYPDLFNGMITDANRGADIAYYTGSTTGTTRNNEICSPFSPITWQVDRKCHLISASSFDRMCQVMEQQADNLKDDLYAHGSRELNIDEHVANNQQRWLRRTSY